MKLKDLFEKNDSDKLVLPDFQREFEWKVDKQKSLIASFMTVLPIGSILILEGNKEDFAAKKIGFPSDTVEPKEECLYLLDGQQRISSLKSIFADFFLNDENWADVLNRLYKGLRHRWFIRVRPKSNEEDIFGFMNLQFKDFKQFEPSQLLDFIERREIFKTKTNEWHNPGFICVDTNNDILSGSRLKNEIAKLAYKDGVIPLYSIYESSKNNEDKPLHEYVIRRLATERVNELKAEVQDGKKNIESLLISVEPDIVDILQTNDEDRLRTAWSHLGVFWSEKVIKFLNELLEQEISIIELPASEINRAIAIFENINSNPTDLDTFDLIVAKAARNREAGSLTQRLVSEFHQDIALPSSLTDGLKGEYPKSWKATQFEILDENKLSKTIKDQYLSMLSIFSYVNYGEVGNIRVEHTKRNKFLNLDHMQINSNTDSATKALKRACAFLQFRCGLTNIKSLPYDLMLLPIAYMLYKDEIWFDKKCLDKVEYWYWSALFGGAYREGQNNQCITDIQSLHEWIDSGSTNNPFAKWFSNVLKDNGYSNEEVLLLKDDKHNVPNAIQKGVLQYILSKQPSDFLPILNGEKIFLNTWDISAKKKIEYNGNMIELSIQDHHICPLSNATTVGESSKEIRKDRRHILNSPLNRTYITSFSNNKINDKPPLEYLEYVEELIQWGHCIPTPFKDIYSLQHGEDSETYYTRVLKRRYQELIRDINNELTSLI